MSFTRILIATADDEMAVFLESHLRDWGYNPARVTDGADAARVLIEATTPHIAILDDILPTYPGVEVVAEVRRRETSRSVWTLLLCNAADAATITSATDAGVDDLVLKPVDPTDFKIRVSVGERVQTLLNQINSQTGTAASFNDQHDKLTGLWNRETLLRMIFSETDRVQRQQTPLTLVLLDVDHFSRINRDYGQQSGDKVLKELGKRLRRYLRSYDLVGRYGADEFLLVLPGCTPEQAVALMQRLKRKVMQQPFSVSGELLTITASSGVAQSLGRSPLVVVHESEKALETAKQAGRNCERIFYAEPEPVYEPPPAETEGVPARILTMQPGKQ